MRVLQKLMTFCNCCCSSRCFVQISMVRIRPPTPHSFLVGLFQLHEVLTFVLRTSMSFCLLFWVSFRLMFIYGAPMISSYLTYCRLLHHMYHGLKGCQPSLQNVRRTSYLRNMETDVWYHEWWWCCLALLSAWNPKARVSYDTVGFAEMRWCSLSWPVYTAKDIFNLKLKI